MPDTALSVEQIPTVGVVRGLSNDAYHGHQATVSKSGLWTIHQKSPAHFRYGRRAETSAMSLGSAIHAALLEPDLFDKEWIAKDWDARTKAGKARADEVEALGLKALPNADYQDVLRIRDTIHADTMLNAVLTHAKGEAEASCFAVDEETGVRFRVRPDWWIGPEGLVLDVKSTKDGRDHGFASDIAKYGYHAQEWLYRRGIAAATGQPVGAFIFLAVETEPPFAYRIIELDSASVEEGGRAMRQALATYADCQRLDEWPAYGSQPTTMSIPRWARTDATLWDAA